MNDQQISISQKMACAMEHIKTAITKHVKNIMTTQAQLDAAIAALPGQIESAVESALEPVIASIQSAASANGIDLTNEVNSLNAIPAAVAQSVATAVAPANPPAAS